LNPLSKKLEIEDLFSLLKYKTEYAWITTASSQVAAERRAFSLGRPSFVSTKSQYPMRSFINTTSQGASIPSLTTLTENPTVETCGPSFVQLLVWYHKKFRHQNHDKTIEKKELYRIICSVD
jgi:hypothetical protein